MQHQTITGPFGKAEELPLTNDRSCAATVCHWLITAPVFHPAWSQYNFHILRLMDVPGLPKANLQFSAATHEIGIVAIDPTNGAQTYESMVKFMTPGDSLFGKMPWLNPVNIGCQVVSTDAEMSRLAPFLIRAIVIRGVTPETSDAPDLVRKYWHEMIQQGIKHLRGEHDDFR